MNTHTHNLSQFSAKHCRSGNEWVQICDSICVAFSLNGFTSSAPNILTHLSESAIGISFSKHHYWTLDTVRWSVYAVPCNAMPCIFGVFWQSLMWWLVWVYCIWRADKHTHTQKKISDKFISVRYVTCVCVVLCMFNIESNIDKWDRMRMILCACVRFCVRYYTWNSIGSHLNWIKRPLI